MSYQVLARKWRPRNFTEMVGQEHVVRALGNALDHGRLHHAYLFTGTRGVGKTTLARILAKSLNCETGVSSTPCGECSVCREIDEGRFVDLLEVDAASRTKVDQTRELLEQVPYAPVRGRYKIYLIDEVHMFSDSSFNALLKTLEEPPPHVKFVLATTDPQKVPVTVLSRCLQFNLKRLPIEQIQGQLRHLLEAEQIEFEGPALFLLARDAEGSMRDGLSLLDQAIGYGGGKVLESDVKAMLGVVSLEALPDLLEAVHAGNGALVLEQIAALAEQAPDFSGLLRDLLTLLHRIALVQTVPEALDPSWGHAERLTALAQRLMPEDVQLYYQIGLLGQRDLPLAPDPRSGFEMALLRMLAFRPDSGGGSRADRTRPVRPAETAPSAAGQPAPAAESRPEAHQGRVQGAVHPSSAPPDVPDLGDWHGALEILGLGGMAAQLASHCTVAVWDGKRLLLHLDPAFKGLIGSKAEQTLARALRQRVGDHLEIKIEPREPQGETPAQRTERDLEQRQTDAVTALRRDPVVEALSERFDAELLEESVRPAESLDYS